MIIKFNPQKSTYQTKASIENEILTYDDISININDLQYGETLLNNCIKAQKNENNEIFIELIWKYKEDSEINCFPKNLEIYSGKIYPKESTK